MAFQLEKAMRGQLLFPAICLKNAELVLNFGGQPFRHTPPGFVGVTQAPKAWTASGWGLFSACILAVTCAQIALHRPALQSLTFAD